MGATYTKGPWTTDLSNSVHEENKYQGIVAGEPYSFGQDGFNVTGFISDADANLIKAAPEMLELLIAFTKAVPNDGSYNYQACMSKANDLITKATGGTES